ncbi:MAG: 3-hydroxyacyl-CoA dehydrogenase [Clostridiales bacterium]|nr:3-hydroxyacyl-CoA dehydrogenase [Clostridiales bacterium]
MMFKNVTLIGGGVLGSQIAYQTAFRGFNVTTYVRSEASIERSLPKLARVHNIYAAQIQAAREGGAALGHGIFTQRGDESPDFDALSAAAESAYENFRYSTDLAEAVRDADLVIEALSENLQEKRDFYEKMRNLLPEKTIIATNSSTLLPSMLADATGRPEKFLALHFANNIWVSNTAEIMGHTATSQNVYDEVSAFAEAINMVPIKLKKEKSGYLLNSLLVPFLTAAQALLVDGIADVETIDKVWLLANETPHGPFQVLDIVGITTAYNIVANSPDAGNPESLSARIAKMLKEDFIDKGKLGISSGEGFYKYK